MRDFWVWYKRIGPPIEFYTRLSPAECRRRLRAATSDWELHYQITAKKYKAKLNPDDTFLLQQRFGFSVRARRPFAGKLEPTPGGGTRISGYIENSASFLGFLVFLLVVVTPIVTYFHGTAGFTAALVLFGVFIVAALFAHSVEKYSSAPTEIRHWLYQLLDGDSTIIDA
ncbi:MAG: hypothetical protein K8I82_18780 [Anaerolineae bacterium]|nr:hypothetical protein [Anaerolineae bacterium]